MPTTKKDEDITNGVPNVTVNINGEPHGISSNTTSNNTTSSDVSGNTQNQPTLPDTTNLNFPVPEQSPRAEIIQETATVINELNKPASNVKTQTGINFIEAFKKSVGDNSNANATEVMLNFGRHLGTLRGSNNSSKTIAREIVNGHHSAGAEIISAYRKTGQRVPKSVMNIIQDLDNLAAHANAVSQMDDRTRVQAIGRGNKSFDSLVIQQQEQALLRELESKSGDILGAEERLEFRKKQLQLDKAEIDLGISQIDLKTKEETLGFKKRQLQLQINKSQVDLESSIIDLETKEEKQILENLSLEEVNNQLSGNAPALVNRGQLQAKRYELLKTQSETQAVINKNNSLAKSTFLGNLTPQAFNLIGEEFAKQEAAGVAIPTVVLKDGAKITLGEYRKEKIIRDKQATEAIANNKTIKEADADARKVIENKQTGAIIMDEIADLDSSLDGVRDNPLFSRLIKDFQDLSDTTNASDSQAKLKEIESKRDQLKTEIIDLIDDDATKRSAKEILTFNRARDLDNTVNSISTRSLESSNNDAAEGGINNNDFFGFNNDVWSAISNTVASQQGISGPDLIGVKTKSDEQPFTSKQRVFGDERYRRGVKDLYDGNIREIYFAKKSDIIINDSADFANEQMRQGNVSQENVAEFMALLDSKRNELFGDTSNPTAFSNKTNSSLVNSIPLEIPVTNEDGIDENLRLINPTSGANVPVVRTIANGRAVLDSFIELEAKAKELGINYDFTKQFNTGFHNETKALVVPLIKPNNIHQHQLMQLSNPAFAENKGLSVDAFHSGTIDRIASQWQNDTTFDISIVENLQSVLSEVAQIEENGFSEESLKRFQLTKQDGNRLEALRKNGIKNAIGEQLANFTKNSAGVTDRSTLFAQQSEIINNINNMSINELIAAGHISNSELIEFKSN